MAKFNNCKHLYDGNKFIDATFKTLKTNNKSRRRLVCHLQCIRYTVKESDKFHLKNLKFNIITQVN